jgi:hypothetical protein
MNLGYVSGIPATPNNPSNDQPNMLINTNNIPTYLAVDHIGFNTNLGGYHKVIHQVNYPSSSMTGNTWNPTTRTGTPSANGMTNQIVSLNYVPAYSGATSDTQLFLVTKGGTISQMTGYVANPVSNFSSYPNSPYKAPNGWQWIGGVLIQWGWVPVLSGAASGTVTFTTYTSGIPFPKSLFSVQTCLTYKTTTIPTAAGVVYVDPGSFSTTGFNWATNSTGFSNNATGFNWLAIGQ